MTDNYWTRRYRNGISRRRFFGGAALGGAGLASLALVGCGNDDDDTGNGGNGGNGNGNGGNGNGNGNGGNGDVQRGGTITVGNPEIRGEFEPNISTSSTDWPVQFAIYDTLMVSTYSGEIQEGLATDWEVNDGQITLTLREGVQFHDGSPFTSDSVRQNAERTLEMGNQSRVYSQWSLAELIETPDDQTVVITLSEPQYGSFIANLTTIAGAMPSPEAIEQLGEDFRSQPVGTGPYRLDEVVLDSHVTLLPFDDFWGAPDNGPYLDSIRFQIQPDAPALVTAMQAGEVDVIHYISAAPSGEIDQLSPLDEINILEETANGFEEVRLNRGKPPFDNPDLLKAFGYAIDRDAMVAALYSGAALPAGGPINPNTWAYDPDFQGYALPTEEREQKVREHLEAAGSPDGFEVILDYAGTATTVQELIAEQVAPYGIVATLQPIPPGEAGSWFYDGGFTAQPSVTPQYSPDPDSIFRPQFHTNGQFNYHRYSVPEVDELLDAAAEETDQDARAEMYHDAQRLIFETGMPRVPRLFPTFRTPVRNTISGIEIGFESVVRVRGARLSS